VVAAEVFPILAMLALAVKAVLALLSLDTLTHYPQQLLQLAHHLFTLQAAIAITSGTEAGALHSNGKLCTDK
jgi:hypothetical protein